MRVGESTVSIYRAGERIATHRLLHGHVRNEYSTGRSHMPEAFLEPEWDEARIMGKAKEVGPSCSEVVERIFAHAKVKEQAYDPALSVLRLSKKYGDTRLEEACSCALPKLVSPRYRHSKSILDSNLDKDIPPEKGRNDKRPEPRGHVRGADYYKD